MELTRRDFIHTSGAVLAGLGVLGSEAVARQAASRRPNIVFVMTDQWRGQALGFTKQDPVQTPCLDAFAQEAVSFNNGLACAPVCGPNRACWLTGRYPQNHGVLKNEAAYLRRFHQKSSAHMLFDLRNDPYQLRPIFKGDGKAGDALIDDLHHELYTTLKARGELIPETAA